MTREEIHAAYTVVNGTIRTPGRFEGEPEYAPYFWEFFLDGGADRDDGRVLSFNVTREDKIAFPQLRNRHVVHLWQSDDGFIYCD